MNTTVVIVATVDRELGYYFHIAKGDTLTLRYRNSSWSEIDWYCDWEFELSVNSNKPYASYRGSENLSNLFGEKQRDINPFWNKPKHGTALDYINAVTEYIAPPKRTSIKNPSADNPQIYGDISPYVWVCKCKVTDSFVPKETPYYHKELEGDIIGHYDGENKIKLIPLCVKEYSYFTTTEENEFLQIKKEDEGYVFDIVDTIFNHIDELGFLFHDDIKKKECTLD